MRSKSSDKRTVLVVLRYPLFRFLWIGFLISDFGDAVHAIAQGWLIAKLTGSPLALGTAMLFWTLPSLLFIPIGGVLADKFDKRRILTFSNSLCFLLVFAFSFLVYGDIVQLWHIYLLVSLLSIIRRAFSYPAENALVPALVPERFVQYAVSLRSVTSNIVGIIGMALGGVIVGVLGFFEAFLLNAFSFLIYVAMVLIIMHKQQSGSTAEQRSRPKQVTIGDITEAWRYLQYEKSLLAIIILFCFINFIGQPIITFAPLFARDILKVGPTGLGFLNMSWAAGMAIGSMIPGFISEIKKPTTWFMPLAWLTGALTFAYPFSSVLFLSMGILFVVGILVSLMLIIQLTAISKTLESVRGKIFSFNMFLHTATLSVSNIVFGVIADKYGIRIPINASGILISLMSILIAMLFKKKGAKV